MTSDDAILTVYILWFLEKTRLLVVFHRGAVHTVCMYHKKITLTESFIISANGHYSTEARLHMAKTYHLVAGGFISKT